MDIDANCGAMQEDRDEFENKVFEVLFGIDARPIQCLTKKKNLNSAQSYRLLQRSRTLQTEYFTVEQYKDYGYEPMPRVFSYEDAKDALEEASKSLQLLHMIKEHFACPSEEEDTEENWKMRELIDRLTRELN
jgi:hypothetical protein